MSPAKITMYSLPESESGPDSASPSHSAGQKQEEAYSKEKSPSNPASLHGENPSTSPNQEAHSDEKPLHNPSSPSYDRNPNPCTNLGAEMVEEPLQNPETCSENHCHGAKKGSSFCHGEGGAEEAHGKEKGAIAAVPRKHPVWVSNRRAEDEPGRRDRCESEMERRGDDLPLPKNLQEVIEALSGDFDEEKYAEMDILEIAEMKGIVFENPPWWPPEGYPDTL